MKHGLLPVIAVLTLLGAGCTTARPQGTETDLSVDGAPAYGTTIYFVEKVSKVDGGYEASLEPASFFFPESLALKAAREDGVCTDEQYRTDGCADQFPNGFYLRRESTTVTYGFARKATFEFQETYQRPGDPLTMSVAEYAAAFAKEPEFWKGRPFLIEWAIPDGTILKAKEFYLP